MDVLAILTGAGGALIGAGIHYGFQRRSAYLAVRKEVVESHLLELQNALQSLYYRIADRICRAVEALTSDRLETLHDSARELIALLEARTGVPSALTLDHVGRP